MADFLDVAAPIAKGLAAVFVGVMYLREMRKKRRIEKEAAQKALAPGEQLQ